jgi:hypothetical protein
VEFPVSITDQYRSKFGSHYGRDREIHAGEGGFLDFISDHLVGFFDAGPAH